MASKIDDVLTAVDVIVQANADFSNTETLPTNEQQTDFFAVTMEGSGRFEGRGAGWGFSFHAVNCFIMGPFTNMKQTFETLKGVCEAISVAIKADETLGATCDTLGNVDYAMANQEVGGVKYTGYKLTVNEIKIPRTF